MSHSKPESINPFEVDLIINHFLAKGALTIQDLKGVRLLSKKWWDASLPQFRKLAKVTIHSNLYDNQLAQWMMRNATPKPNSNQAKVGIPLLEFLAFHLDLGNKCFDQHPFRHFRLEAWVILNLNVDDYDNYMFWEFVAKHITSLELSHCYFDNFRTLTTALFRKLPLLEELTLEGIRFHHRLQLVNSPLVENQNRAARLGNLKVLNIVGDFHPKNDLGGFKPDVIFMECPNLETLSLKNMSVSQMELVIRDLAAVRQFKNFGTLKLTKLELIPKKEINEDAQDDQQDSNELPMLTPTIFQALEQLRLPLKELTLGFAMTPMILYRMEQLHHETLETDIGLAKVVFLNQVMPGFEMADVDQNEGEDEDEAGNGNGGNNNNNNNAGEGEGEGAAGGNQADGDEGAERIFGILKSSFYLGLGCLLSLGLFVGNLYFN